MQTLTSQYGRESLTLADEIPTHALRDLLGWKHVSTPDSEITEWVRGKVARQGYTPEQLEQTIAAALWLHAENRAEYRWVMRGAMPA